MWPFMTFECDRKELPSYNPFFWDLEEIVFLIKSFLFYFRHGWSKLSLSSGAEDLGYISIVSGLFER